MPPGARFLAAQLFHRLPDLSLHLWRHFCGASGKLRRPPFSILLNIIDEQLHLDNFADLGLNDLIRQLANPWIANARLPCVVDGNGVVWDHRLHEVDIPDQRLAPIHVQQRYAEQCGQNQNCDFGSHSFVHRPHEG